MVGEWLLKEYDEALEISEDDEIDEAVKSAILKKMPTSEDDTTHGFRLVDGINFVANLLRISKSRLSKWIAHYLLHKELMPLIVRKPPPLLDHTSKVSKAHILEAMSLLRDRNSKGLQTNYTLVVTHLMGEERINPYLDLDNCPPVQLSVDCITYAMRKITGYGWCEVEPKGATGKTEEQKLQRMWRQVLYFSEHHRNLYLQHVLHTHVIAYTDESFAHEMHHGPYSLMPMGPQQMLLAAIYAQVRNGLRICVTGGMSCYGHITGYYYWGGKWHVYRDCMWVDKNNIEVMKGGRYVELTGEVDQATGIQKIRAIYIKPQKPKKLKNYLLLELRLLAIEEDVDLHYTNEKGVDKPLAKAGLIAKIEAKRAQVASAAAFAAAFAASSSASSSEGAEDERTREESAIEFNSARGIAECLEQCALTDWDLYQIELSDCAPCGDRSFVAYAHEGDYHNNVDSKMKFKFVNGLVLAWKFFMRHLQRIKEFRCRGVSRLDDGSVLVHDPACALYGKYTIDPNDPLYGEHVPDFYNWDWVPAGTVMDDMEGSRRNMILEHDNAPYCHGVEVQLSSYSREKCADLLRKLGIGHIIISRPDNDKTLWPKTPSADGIPWDTATHKITAAEIKSATKDAVLKLKPSLLKPGYMSLCEKYKIIVTFTCPYTSNLCCIESKWQIAKSELANPHNQKSGRSCAEVVIIMRKKWYDVLPDRGSGPKDPIDMNIFVRHCHRLMNEELDQLRTSNPPGVFPLIGNVTDFSGSIDSSELMFGQAVRYKMMLGGPTCERDWNDLKERAGILTSRLGDVTQGDDVDGDPLNLPELAAYEQAAAFGDVD